MSALPPLLPGRRRGAAAHGRRVRPGVAPPRPATVDGMKHASTASAPVPAPVPEPVLDPAEVPRHAGRAFLTVMTDPVRARLVDLLAEGPASLADLTESVAERVPTSPELVEAHLSVMAAAGFAWSDDPDGVRARSRRWSGLDLEAFSERLEDLVELMDELRDAGDHEQVGDAAGALDAAWNGRRREPGLRAVAAAFHASPAGRRHAARVRAGVLGVPAPPPRDARSALPPGDASPAPAPLGDTSAVPAPFGDASPAPAPPRHRPDPSHREGGRAC